MRVTRWESLGVGSGTCVGRGEADGSADADCLRGRARWEASDEAAAWRMGRRNPPSLRVEVGNDTILSRDLARRIYTA